MKSRFLRRSKKLVTVIAPFAIGTSALHAQNAVVATNEVQNLSPIVVTGRSDSLLGIADSAGVGTVGVAQLQARPIMRPGELLETIPGVIITQHSGAGKANQYYLRGFNLDHGTDLATSLDGMPVNLPTHAHGQGYTDLNFMIPELVEAIDYKHGPYSAEDGDFASAGAVNIRYANTLPQNFVTLEGGSFGYARAVTGISSKAGQGSLLFGGEAYHNDGPWIREDDYRKFNGVLRYSQGTSALGWSITAMGYHGKWNATDQLAQRAVDGGVIPGFVDRFGSLDTTTGGDSQRYSLLAEWHRATATSTTRLMAYGFYYDLDLFSNFSYVLNDPVNGDQFEQQDRRYVGGFKASHEWQQEWFGKPVNNTVGLQFRTDSIRNGLFNTAARQRLATTREDDVLQASIAPYVENRVQWGEKFRTVAGLRADYFHFNVDSDNAANSGDKGDVIVSPKLNLIFGPWAQTEFYLSGGLGFHSNDGRGSTTTIDPASGAAVTPVDPLVRTMGAEVGVRSTFVPGLQSTLSLWMLDIDSELLFVGDAGTTEPSRPSRRYGVEFANYYSPTKWLTFDADFAMSRSHFRDEDPAGRYIPGSIETVVAAGVAVHDLHGFFGSLRMRYFGPRSLIEDDSVRSSETILLNAQVGYQFNKTWTLNVEIFNLLNRKDSDVDYFYESRLPGEPVNPDPALNGGYNNIHFHPVEPIAVRVGLTARF